MKITPEIMAVAVLCDSGRYYYHAPGRKTGEWLKYVDACPGCGEPFLARGHSSGVFDTFCERACVVAHNKRKVEARAKLADEACAQWKMVVAEITKGQACLSMSDRGVTHVAPIKSGIYQIVNSANGKVYVGSAVQLPTRWATHRVTLQKNMHGSEHLQHAWDKYGEAAFGFSVLEFVEDPAQLIAREQVYLDALFALGCGYNISPTAGSTLGRVHSAETKQKIREKATGRKQNLTDETRKAMSEGLLGNKRGAGKKRSPEQRARMSEAQRQRGPRKPFSEETKAKMRESARKRAPMSDTTKALISAASTGHTLSAEVREVLREKATGRHHTEETKALLSAQRKGVSLGPISDETRAKMSASHRGRVASAEDRAKQSARQMGRKHSEETKAKLRAARARQLEAAHADEVDHVA